MALDQCDICSCPAQAFTSKEGFMAGVIRLLCAQLAQQQLDDTEFQLLVDNAAGTDVPFLRAITVDENGNRVVSDVQLDGTTPYVPVGTVGDPLNTLPATASVSITRPQNTTGTVSAGAYAVSILNIGSASGLVNGVELEREQEVALQGFHDPNTRQFFRLPAITWDASSTAFYIVDIR